LASDVIVDLVKVTAFPTSRSIRERVSAACTIRWSITAENDPPMLLCNHEKIAVQIARYARASGKPMIAISRAAPSASAFRSNSSTSLRS
jgi:acetolactate synthase-1/2/3 large subunit